jgi:hypothetical protein
MTCSDKIWDGSEVINVENWFVEALILEVLSLGERIDDKTVFFRNEVFG